MRGFHALAAVMSMLAAPDAVFAASPSPGPSPSPSPMRFQRMDTNRDGVITRDEWRGNDRSFADHDGNGDGVLSGPEVKPGAQPCRRSRTTRPPSPAPAASASPSPSPSPTPSPR